MKNKFIRMIIKSAVFPILFGGMVSCGSTQAISHTDQVGAALVTVFDGNVTSSAQSGLSGVVAELRNLFVGEAQACAFMNLHHTDGSSPSTCEAVNSSSSGLSKQGLVKPGDYGSKTRFVTLSGGEDCATDEADSNAYASFTLTAKNFECSDSSGTTSQLVITEGSGVWQNDTTANTTDFFGSFIIQSEDGSTQELNCSFTFFDSSQSDERIEGSCDDENGNTIDQSTNVSCLAT